MGSHALNMIRRKGSIALKRQKDRLRKRSRIMNNKDADLMDFSQNALLSVTNSDPTQLTNAHQLKAMKSNPNTNTIMSRKKLKKLRKRIVVRDKASGELKPLILANIMDA